MVTVTGCRSTPIDTPIIASTLNEHPFQKNIPSWNNDDTNQEAIWIGNSPFSKNGGGARRPGEAISYDLRLFSRCFMCFHFNTQIIDIPDVLGNNLRTTFPPFVPPCFTLKMYVKISMLWKSHPHQLEVWMLRLKSWKFRYWPERLIPRGEKERLFHFGEKAKNWR